MLGILRPVVYYFALILPGFYVVQKCELSPLQASLEVVFTGAP